MGEDTADVIRIDNAAVRESHIWMFGELTANRDKNEVRDSLDSLKKSAALSKDDNNNNNGINNSNNNKNGDVNVGGRGAERGLAPAGDIIPRIY